MNQHQRRPLSPHLQVYKPQITSIGSILHRISGILLSVFSLIWVYWLLALHHSADAYLQFQQLLQSWPGKLITLVAAWALFYHMMTGIRHMIWDSVHMLELDVAKRSGWVIVSLSLVFTLLAAGVWL
ncbi:MAG: succinate dehydrogenase, cytochrome b556 subunit [Gammaproteobacteria bacterium]|jgi:succinate dehydrogenase / fumarate reductase cytochrome b subunit|nr:succinate dehydrogenase, cytochrome b556 subunit [Gammaproteobacteria bacterium]